MKKNILSTITLVLMFTAGAFLCGCDDNPSLLPWTTKINNANCYSARNYAVDMAGNSYLIGVTYSEIDGMTPANGIASYIMKFDNAGNKQWAHLIESTNADIMILAQSVTVDGSGNCYISGSTNGDFSDQLMESGFDGFLCKYDPSGERQWAVLLELPTGEYAGGAIARADSAGNCTVFSESYDDLTSICESFLLKFDASGAVMSKKSLGTTQSSGDTIRMMALDKAGNTYITGSLKGYASGSFDSIIAGSITGLEDAFIVKYDPSGEKKWVRLLGSAGSETYGMAIAVDTDGNCYVTGNAYGDLDGQQLTGDGNIFTVKYDTNGTKKWLKLAGPAGEEEFAAALSIAVDAAGNSYVAGTTCGDMDGQTVTGVQDALVIKYGKSGVKAWTKLISYLDGSIAQAIGNGVDMNGINYVMGSNFVDSGEEEPAPGSIFLFITNEFND